MEPVYFFTIFVGTTIYSTGNTLSETIALLTVPGTTGVTAQLDMTR